jgi:hypothetical protein
VATIATELTSTSRGRDEPGHPDERAGRERSRTSGGTGRVLGGLDELDRRRPGRRLLGDGRGDALSRAGEELLGELGAGRVDGTAGANGGLESPAAGRRAELEDAVDVLVREQASRLVGRGEGPLDLVATLPGEALRELVQLRLAGGDREWDVPGLERGLDAEGEEAQPDRDERPDERGESPDRHRSWGMRGSHDRSPGVIHRSLNSGHEGSAMLDESQ